VLLAGSFGINTRDLACGADAKQLDEGIVNTLV